MIRGLYTLVFILALPLILLRLLWRARRTPAYGARVAERFGGGPATSGEPIWIHAVSVGETVAIAPLVLRLLEQQPTIPLLITTMTPTGAERVRALFGDRVQHRFCPWDLPWFWGRFMRRHHPRLCLIVETELWPNMLAACAARGIPSLLANARMSERSARGYRRLSALTRPMLECLSLVAAQSMADGERLLALGVPQARLQVTGSIKFDLSISDSCISQGAELRQHLGRTRPVLIGASTHEGEEALLLRTWQRLSLRWPELALILVPRHPERFEAVAELVGQFSQRVCRRSQGQTPNQATEIYLGDTMGELMLLYAAADIALVGGSFSGTGGHNPLEPAALGKPVVMGPDRFNFAQITQALIEAGGLNAVADETALQPVLAELIGDEEQRQRQGSAARRFVLANKGALARLQALLERLLACPAKPSAD